MANYKAFVVVALALGAFLAVPRAGAEGTEEDYDQNKATDSGGCDNQDSSGSDCPCKEDEQTDPGNGCVQISVDMGRTRYSALTKGVSLQLKELQATSQLYIPDGFKVLAGYTVKRASWEKTAAGLPKWVQIASDGGLLTDFLFADGSSVGILPAGPESRTRQRLVMVDAQGWATATDPAFYDFYPGDGSRWRFGAARNAPDYLSFIEHQTPQGRLETEQDIGLEILRDASGGLRQVVTPSRLADFVVTGTNAYTLTVYPNDAACVSGTRSAEGFVEVLPGAVPESVWRFSNPAPGTYGVLEVTREKPGAQPQTWRYEFVEAVNDFVLKHPGGVREDRAERLKTDNGNRLMIRKESRDANGKVFNKVENKYVKKGYKYVRQTLVRDPGGLDLTTSYGYYEGGTLDGLERVKVGEDGSWTVREYDDSRRLTAEIRPWLDAPTNAPLTQCAATRYGYTLFAAGDFLSYNDQRPRTVVNEVCGVEVSRTYHAYPTNALGQAQEIEERAAFPGAPYGHASNPRTVKTYYAATAASPLPGRLANVAYPGGKTETYGYEYGTYNALTFVFTADPGGGAWRETVTAEYPDDGRAGSPKPPHVQTTRSVRAWDEKGREVLDESYVEDGAAFARIGWTRMSYDRNGKLTETAYSDGRVESATWGANCCGKESETSAEGIITVYGYNALKQKVSETKKGMAADGSGDITTLRIYDLENQVLSVSVTNEASGLGYVDYTRDYDAVGRLTRSTDRLGVTDNYVYSLWPPSPQYFPDPNATPGEYQYTGRGRSVCVTRAGRTTFTVYYPDGRLRFVEVDGSRRQSYAYGVDPSGAVWTLSVQGNLPSVPSRCSLSEIRLLASELDCAWTISVKDMLGNGIATEYFGFGKTRLVVSNVFDIAGNNVEMTEYAIPSFSNGPFVVSRILGEYEASGLRRHTAVDINTNGVIDFHGPDRVVGKRKVYERDGSNDWWTVSYFWVYPEFSSTVAVTTMVSRTKIAGLAMLQQKEASAIAYSEVIDIRGNVSRYTTLTDRSARRVTQVSTTESSSQPAIRVTVNGVLESEVSPSSVTNRYTYDSLDRQVRVTDGRDNTTITAYTPLGQVDYVEDAASIRSAYSYDTLGRRISVTDAFSNTVYTAYDIDGHVIAQWGATCPVAYEFDAYGRMIAMATTHEPGFGFTNLLSVLPPNMVLSATSHPLYPAGLDTVRWFRDQSTGFITNTMYADGKHVSYGYTPDGKVASRVWARGIATTYGYDAGNFLTTVKYSDDTPEVSISYDRLGRQLSCLTAVSTNVFTYSATTLEPLMETQNGVKIVRALDIAGRSSGINLGPDYCVEYLRDGYGRLENVISCDAGIALTNTYTYLPGSDLITHVSAGPLDVTKTYESSRNIVVSVSNQINHVGTTSILTHDYKNDVLGRRAVRIDTTQELPITNSFGYNLRSEIATVALGTNIYSYVYAPNGCRLLATANSVTNMYIPQAFEQYAVISNGQSGIYLPIYDEDGNMTSYGAWAYKWDAENRLVCATSNGVLVVANVYDHLSRRIKKFSCGMTDGIDYLYDGWSLIRETYKRRGSDNLCTNYYTWGLDLSGSKQGVGGVGGLLVVAVSKSVNDESSVFLPLYDANGNITKYLDEKGEIVASFEYDAFGNSGETSSVDAVLPFRFATKYWDAESRLINYGFRFYFSELGRFLGRDPIQELGFRERIGPLLDDSNILINDRRRLDDHNDLINGFDVLGLAEIPKPGSGIGYVKCNDNCQMEVSGCDETTAKETGIPVSCCKKHEEKHISDIKRKGNWCTKDAAGCCNGKGTAADNNSYEPQPPKDHNLKEGMDISMASECNAWEETMGCCLSEKNKKCQETAREVLKNRFCHEIRNIPFREDWNSNNGGSR